MERLRRFTVEIDRPAAGWGDLQEVIARARRSAAGDVRLLRAVFVPEDESCFFIYEGPSARLVREAARRAELAGVVQQTMVEVDR